MKLFENEQLISATPEWRYWSPAVPVHLILVSKVTYEKITFSRWIGYRYYHHKLHIISFYTIIWRRSGVLIVNFEHISHLVLVFLTCNC